MPKSLLQSYDNESNMFFSHEAVDTLEQYTEMSIAAIEYDEVESSSNASQQAFFKTLLKTDDYSNLLNEVKHKQYVISEHRKHLEELNTVTSNDLLFWLLKGDGTYWLVVGLEVIRTSGRPAKRWS